MGGGGGGGGGVSRAGQATIDFLTGPASIGQQSAETALS